MESLVGLRAIDVTKLLAEKGYFEIKSYNQAIALVVPVIEDKSQLVKLYRLLEKMLDEKENV